MKTPQQLIDQAVQRLNENKEYETQRRIEEIIRGIAEELRQKELCDERIRELQKELREISVTEINRESLGL